MTRLLAIAGFGGFLFVATQAMDLVGVVFGLGLIIFVALCAGMVYAVTTTQTGVRPPIWWKRPERRTVTDVAPELTSQEVSA